MAIKSYLVELVTEVPITIDDSEATNEKSVYELVADKTQTYINDYIKTDDFFLMKIVAEVNETELEQISV